VKEIIADKDTEDAVPPNWKNADDAVLPNWSYHNDGNQPSTPCWISPHRKTPFRSLTTALYFDNLISMNRNNEWSAWKELSDGKVE